MVIETITFSLKLKLCLCLCGASSVRVYMCLASELIACSVTSRSIYMPFKTQVSVK